MSYLNGKDVCLACRVLLGVSKGLHRVDGSKELFSWVRLSLLFASAYCVLVSLEGKLLTLALGGLLEVTLCPDRLKGPACWLKRSGRRQSSSSEAVAVSLQTSHRSLKV